MNGATAAGRNATAADRNADAPAPRKGTVPAHQRRYRDLMGAFPTGVAVVTSLDAEGMPRGATCSSLTSVTPRPPTLLVSLRGGSATLAAVTAHGSFAVNLLHSGGQHLAELFSAPESGRFAHTNWRRTPTGLPHLAEAAFAVADCRVSELIDVGDHTLVLGEVGAIGRGDGTPLLYGLRRFTAWPHPSPSRRGHP